MKEIVVINKDIVGKYQPSLIDAAIMKNKDNSNLHSVITWMILKSC